MSAMSSVPIFVPDYMTAVKDGAFYGWPYSYFGQHLDPRVSRNGPIWWKRLSFPTMRSAPTSPLGPRFLHCRRLPEKYRGGAFVGEHGSWDRQKFNGYKVVFVPFSGGHPNGQAEDVVTGFSDATVKRAADQWASP